MLLERSCEREKGLISLSKRAEVRLAEEDLLVMEEALSSVDRVVVVVRDAESRVAKERFEAQEKDR